MAPITTMKRPVKRPQGGAEGGGTQSTERKEEGQRCLTGEMLRLYISRRWAQLLNCSVFENDVKPYKDVAAKRVMPYRVKRVVSPYEFYVEYAIEDLVRGYGEWFSVMQKYYNNTENATQRLLNNGLAMKGRCYVFQDSRDKFWHRVRAHDIDHKAKTALVFFCDLGKRQKVKFESLREIHPTFCTWSAQVFRGYLYDVIPIDGSYTWSPEAIHFFKEFVKNKVFSGIVMSRSDEVVCQGYPDVMTQMGLVMVEKRKGKKTASPVEALGTVNALMVDNGFAFPVGIFGSCDNTFMKDRLNPVFERKEYEKHFPVPVPAPVTSASPGKLEKLSQVLMSTEESCKPPGMSSWAPLWLTNGIKPSIGLGNQITYQNTTDRLPKKITDHLAFIKMVFVLSPSHIIVHLQSKVNELRDMQNVICLAVENKPPLITDELSAGAFVACHIYDDEDNDVRIWSRGVVKAVNHTANSVKVLLVDYGNEVSCRMDYVRFLPEPFWDIPSFAIRIHLDVAGLLPTGQSGWSNEACLMFRRYAFAWETAEPLYYMYRPRQAKDLWLTDYTQDIQFNFDTKEWDLGHEPYIDSHKAINQLKDHPMLQSIFRSTGVELYYEVIVPDSTFWFFEPIYDDNLKMGLARWEKNQPSPDEIHLIVVDKHGPPPTASYSGLGVTAKASNPQTTSKVLVE